MPLQIDYSVARKWKNGFEATIAVTNAGAAPITDWQVTFDFFDVALIEIHDAVIVAETEGIYTLAPLSGGPALLPGGTATVSFTACGNAARLPLFVSDEDDDDADEDGLWTDPADTVVAFPDRTPASGARRPFVSTSAADRVPANCDHGLSPTDGLVLNDGEVRDLLARVDWMYFEGGAMTRVQGLLGMGDRMPLPRPANENCDPFCAGSSSLSSNGSTSVPQPTPAAGGACGTATDARRVPATDADPVQEPARSRSSARPAASPLQEPGQLPPFPPLPPRDDWLL